MIDHISLHHQHCFSISIFLQMFHQCFTTRFQNLVPSLSAETAACISYLSHLPNYRTSVLPENSLFHIVLYNNGVKWKNKANLFMNIDAYFDWHIYSHTVESKVPMQLWSTVLEKTWNGMDFTYKVLANEIWWCRKICKAKNVFSYAWWTPITKFTLGKILFGSLRIKTLQRLQAILVELQAVSISCQPPLKTAVVLKLMHDILQWYFKNSTKSFEHFSTKRENR